MQAQAAVCSHALRAAALVEQAQNERINSEVRHQKVPLLTVKLSGTEGS